MLKQCEQKTALVLVMSMSHTSVSAAESVQQAAPFAGEQRARDDIGILTRKLSVGCCPKPLGRCNARSASKGRQEARARAVELLHLLREADFRQTCDKGSLASGKQQRAAPHIA